MFIRNYISNLCNIYVSDTHRYLKYKWSAKMFTILIRKFVDTIVYLYLFNCRLKDLLSYFYYRHLDNVKI